MRKLRIALGLMLAAALACDAFAGERTEGARRRRGTRVTGTFTSAKTEGGVIKWSVKLEDGTAKEFEMKESIVVMYMERDEKKRVLSIRQAGNRAPRARGTRKVAQGTFVSADVQDEQVTITAEVETDGAKAKQTFSMTKKVRMTTRERDGKTTVVSIGSVRVPEPSKKPDADAEKK